MGTIPTKGDSRESYQREYERSTKEAWFGLVVLVVIIVLSIIAWTTG